jgi:hypothetical protein
MQKQRCNGIERKLITHRPQPIDHARGDKRYKRALALRFALAMFVVCISMTGRWSSFNAADYRYRT